MNSTPFLIRAFNKFLNREENIRSSYNALKTIAFDHERLHAGRMFNHSDVSTIAAGATDTLLFSVGSDMPIHLRHVGYQINVGPCEGYLYENPYIDVNSIGTGFRPDNLNRESSYAGVNSFYHKPYVNVNSLGTRIDAGAVVQATGGSVKSIQGLAESAVIEWVLARGKNYVFRFTNKNGGTGIYTSNLAFYEPWGSDQQ